MPKFFRVDEWNAQGNRSDIHFCETQADAMRWVKYMEESTPLKTEGEKHTTIQPFTAETCDMDGWNSADHSQTEPTHYL